MFWKIGLAFLLSASLATLAQAQSLDGTYRGQAKFIKQVELIPGGDRCTRGGQIEFRVVGSTIELIGMTTALFGRVLSAPLAADGSFRISGQRPGRGPNPIIAEWVGTVKNLRIEGTSVGQGRGRVCHFTFAARKR